MNKKKCTECKNCIEKEYGYSNWTVEGIDCYCLFDLNPDFPADGFYGEEPVLQFAETCSEFVYGDPIRFDVEDGGAFDAFMDKR